MNEYKKLNIEYVIYEGDTVIKIVSCNTKKLNDIRNMFYDKYLRIYYIFIQRKRYEKTTYSYYIRKGIDNFIIKNYPKTFILQEYDKIRIKNINIVETSVTITYSNYFVTKIPKTEDLIAISVEPCFTRKYMKKDAIIKILENNSYQEIFADENYSYYCSTKKARGHDFSSIKYSELNFFGSKFNDEMNLILDKFLLELCQNQSLTLSQLKEQLYQNQIKKQTILQTEKEKTNDIHHGDSGSYRPPPVHHGDNTLLQKIPSDHHGDNGSYQPSSNHHIDNTLLQNKQPQPQSIHQETTSTQNKYNQKNNNSIINSKYKLQNKPLTLSQLQEQLYQNQIRNQTISQIEIEKARINYLLEEHIQKKINSVTNNKRKYNDNGELYSPQYHSQSIRDEYFNDKDVSLTSTNQHGNDIINLDDDNNTCSINNLNISHTQKKIKVFNNTHTINLDDDDELHKITPLEMFDKIEIKKEFTNIKTVHIIEIKFYKSEDETFIIIPDDTKYHIRTKYDDYFKIENRETLIKRYLIPSGYTEFKKHIYKINNKLKDHFSNFLFEENRLLTAEFLKLV